MIFQSKKFLNELIAYFFDNLRIKDNFQIVYILFRTDKIIKGWNLVTGLN
jgi:hypothetical protein